MADRDPRQTIKAIIDDYLAANRIKKDDGAADASVISLWEGGPETLKYLFYSADYDIVITFAEPKSRAVRRIQDIPIHFLMSYFFTVSTVDKPLMGARICTAVRMQYKVTLALRKAIAASAQSAAGATPAYTLSIQSDTATHKRVGGLDIYETTHVAEYETDYG